MMTSAWVLWNCCTCTRINLQCGAQGQVAYGMPSQQQVPQWAQTAIASQALGGQAQQYAQQVEVPTAAVPVRRHGRLRA